MIISGLFLAVLGLLLPGRWAAGDATSNATKTTSPRRDAVVEVIEKVSPCVVNIHSERTVQGPAVEDLFAFAPSQNRINGMGTGVIIDSRGYIVTNQHVVEEVNVIRVRLADKSTYAARVLA